MKRTRKRTLIAGLITLVTATAVTTFLNTKDNPFPDLNTPKLPIEGLAPETPLIRVIYPSFCPDCNAFQQNVMGKISGEIVSTRRARLQIIPALPRNMEQLPENRQAIALEVALGTMCHNRINGAINSIWYAKMSSPAVADRTATLSELRSIGRTPMDDEKIPAYERCVNQQDHLTDIKVTTESLTSSGLSDNVHVLVGDRLVTDRWGRSSWQLEEIRAEVNLQRKDRSRGLAPAEY